jgi:hypothetical protein
MVAMEFLRFPFPSPHHCGLDGDRRAGGDRRRIALRPEHREGRREVTFLLREEWRL